MDDAAAARVCLAGNTEGFRHFVDRYQSRALAHARLLTRNDADAADATQDAFVDAFRNLRAFDAGRAFYPWFYVLLRNRCFKQTSRRGTRSESAIVTCGVDRGVSEESVDLWRAIRRLPLGGSSGSVPESTTEDFAQDALAAVRVLANATAM